ncbi:DUF3331 domain-containing protein [Paraburkholderia graminis]|nr:DUF3331 domain-containing protein [Paraburkholderia graminis]
MEGEIDVGAWSACNVPFARRVFYWRAHLIMTKRVDPWAQTIHLLLSGSRCEECAGRRTSAHERMTPCRSDAYSNVNCAARPVVSLIERTSPSAVTIQWRDSTSCFYGAQIWRVAGAKVSGVCVLTGQWIRRGDRIYHPWRSNPEPVNAHAMILESALELMAPLQPTTAP